MTHTDNATNVREGEELDRASVETYLKDSLPGLSGPVTIRQFPSGFSNLTYLLSVGGRELVLRRPPFGKKAKTAHDMEREYRMLKALKPVFPYSPEALLYCEDQSVMGCSFYVMERLKGIILRKNLPEGMTLSTADARSLCTSMIEVIHKLHSADYRKIGLADYGKPEGYVQRQVEGWSTRYRDAKTPDSKDFEAVMLWLHDHIPPDTTTPGIIHNDFKFYNLVLNTDKTL